MSFGVGRRCSLDPAWLWLWPAATAPTRPLKSKKKSPSQKLDGWSPMCLYSYGSSIQARLQLKSCFMLGTVLDKQTHTHTAIKEGLRDLWGKDRLQSCWHILTKEVTLSEVFLFCIFRAPSEAFRSSHTREGSNQSNSCRPALQPHQRQI